MATSEAQSKSLIFQAQYLVADQLNKCEDLSATPFWPEDLLDIEYQIHNALSEQGIACTVMTPKLNYQGMCGKSTAWDFSNLQLVIVENPQINRARENAMTALDIGYVAQEWLAGPRSETRGMFVPVSISQGEDGKLVVVTVELRALLHDDKLDPLEEYTYAVLDGELLSARYEGAFTEAMFHAFAPSSYTQITDVSVGTAVTSLSSYAFNGGASLSRAMLPSTVQDIGEGAFFMNRALVDVQMQEGVSSIGSRCFYDCKALKTLDVPSSVVSIGYNAFATNSSPYSQGLDSILFRGKSMEQVSAMANYPWGIQDTSIISAEL